MVLVCPSAIGVQSVWLAVLLNLVVLLISAEFWLQPIHTETFARVSQSWYFSFSDHDASVAGRIAWPGGKGARTGQWQLSKEAIAQDGFNEARINSLERELDSETGAGTCWGWATMPSKAHRKATLQWHTWWDAQFYEGLKQSCSTRKGKVSLNVNSHQVWHNLIRPNGLTCFDSFILPTQNSRSVLWQAENNK